ncbi:hypothetical protein RISK_002037 [Rhodopirellula islandica]|uniref:Uncharacterized protein n=1 Tax=Rhodopirellula islandica TaxID=595434 RepID=A0A0J1BI13_RHOIS|nr:hypothetical protein RISK_002037 [Rhodopirellula islandica]
MSSVAVDVDNGGRVCGWLEGWLGLNFGVTTGPNGRRLK